MARCSKLTVTAGLSNFRKKIFIHISPYIRCLNFAHHLINFVQRIYHLRQHQRCRQFKDCVIHIFGIRTVFVTMQCLNEWKYPFLHHRIHPISRKVVKYRPFQLRSVNRSFSYFYFFHENTLIRQAKHGTLFGTNII